MVFHPFVQDQRLSASVSPSSSRALTLNPVLRQPNLLASLKNAFAECKDLELTEDKRALKVQVSHEPFSVGRLFHFLQVCVCLASQTGYEMLRWESRCKWLNFPFRPFSCLYLADSYGPLILLITVLL